MEVHHSEQFPCTQVKRTDRYIEWKKQKSKFLDICQVINLVYVVKFIANICQKYKTKTKGSLL